MEFNSQDKILYNEILDTWLILSILNYKCSDINGKSSYDVRSNKIVKVEGVWKIETSVTRTFDSLKSCRQSQTKKYNLMSKKGWLKKEINSLTINEKIILKPFIYDSQNIISNEDAIALMKKYEKTYLVTFSDIFGIEGFFQKGIEYFAEKNDDSIYDVETDFGKIVPCMGSRFSSIVKYKQEYKQEDIIYNFFNAAI